MPPKREIKKREQPQVEPAPIEENIGVMQAEPPKVSAIDQRNTTMKAAAVMIALGTESASEVFKYLHDDEIEILSNEIAQIQHLSSDEINDIINEFYEMCVAQKAITEGGIGYANSVLLKAFGQQRAGELLNKAANKGKSPVFEFVATVDPKNLMMILQNEHPQIIAVVLSYATPEQASEIIAALDPVMQLHVIERISSLERANPETLAIVDKMLQKRLSTMATVNTIDRGGINYIAEIMNRIDKNSQKSLFDGLVETNPELADQIKKLMFTFNDIITLNDMEIQAFIREADAKDLTVALKGAKQNVQERIFSNMSTRQKDMIQSDMQYLHNLRMRDVEAAQQRIIDAIRKLEDAGDIVLFKGGDDEIIA